MIRTLKFALRHDAMRDAFDTAIVITADSDLISPIVTVLHSYPGKRVVVAFPPNRHSEQLRHQATAAFRLGRRIIADSQFPTQVIDANGFRPAQAGALELKRKSQRNRRLEAHGRSR